MQLKQQNQVTSNPGSWQVADAGSLENCGLVALGIISCPASYMSSQICSPQHVSPLSIRAARAFTSHTCCCAVRAWMRIEHGSVSAHRSLLVSSVPGLDLGSQGLSSTTPCLPLFLLVVLLLNQLQAGSCPGVFTATHVRVFLAGAEGNLILGTSPTGSNHRSMQSDQVVIQDRQTGGMF